MPKVIPPMSELRVRQLDCPKSDDGKLKSKLYNVGGVDGLILQCKPNASKASCSKSWILRANLDGKRKDFGLGSYRNVTLKQARDRAIEYRKLIEQGRNPAELKKAKSIEKAEQIRKNIKFSALSKEYVEAKSKSFKTLKQTQKLTSHLNIHVIPYIGGKSINDITSDDIFKLLNKIWFTKNETATRVRSVIENIFELAKSKGLLDGSNPAVWKGNLSIRLPQRSKVAPVKHHPSMPYADLPLFVRYLNSLELISAKAIEFLILTSCRSGEVREAKWQDVSFQDNVWTIPAFKTKSGRSHRIPLSRQSVSILNNLKTDSEYIFPNKLGSPLTDVALSKQLKRYRAEFTIHGFRTSFRTWGQEQTSFSDEALELSLAHSKGDSVRAAYARSDLLDIRREIMSSWGDFCYEA
ncbi:MAG: tyrosine-type recombinase/integrase [Hellea sp.]